MTQFFISYVLMLISGSLFMTGWFAITRGRIEYTVDGEAFKTGKLFNGWHFFWTGGTEISVELKGEQLKSIWFKIYKELPSLSLNETATALYFNVGDFVIVKEKIFHLEMMSGCKVFQHSSFIVLSKKVKKYNFPELLRDPISECPTCMASVYGSIYYWSVVLLNNKIFEWATYPVAAALVFWVFFCIGCAFINTILAKKL